MVVYIVSYEFSIKIFYLMYVFFFIMIIDNKINFFFINFYIRYVKVMFMILCIYFICLKRSFWGFCVM